MRFFGVQSPRFEVQLFHAWPEAAERWTSLLQGPQASPFQSARWLSTWYETLGRLPGHEPLLVEVRDAETQSIAMALPLVILRTGAHTTIAFADLETTDYNAPLLGPAAPRTRRDARSAWRAITRALPEADVVFLDKMMPEIAGRPNPLALAASTGRTRILGTEVQIGPDYETWLRGFARKDRKEMARLWRVFLREPEAAFVQASTPEEAEEIFDLIEREQASRMAAMGQLYRLGDGGYAELYRKLVAGGMEDGTAVLTGLKSGGTWIAGLLTLVDGHRCVTLRLAFAAERDSRFAPGRLLMERTMRALHAAGYHTINLGFGDHAYKQRLHAEPLVLLTGLQALSWRAVPAVAFARLKAGLVANRRLESCLRQVARRFIASKSLARGEPLRERAARNAAA